MIRISDMSVIYTNDTVYTCFIFHILIYIYISDICMCHIYRSIYMRSIMVRSA